MLSNRGEALLAVFLVLFNLTVLGSFFIKGHKIDGELKPYYTEVIDIVKDVCPATINSIPHQISVVKESLGSDIIGRCSYYFVGFRIQVDESFFKYASDDARFQLMAHELTHCLIQIKHLDDWDHYMYPHFFTVPRIKLERQIRELFKETCHADSP